mgnify:FL=1
MKLLYSALLVGCSHLCTYAQQISEFPCSISEDSYKVLIRKSFQNKHSNIKFSPRELKLSEICFIESIQDETEIVVQILDARHEIVIYPSNINDLD